MSALTAVPGLAVPGLIAPGLAPAPPAPVSQVPARSLVAIPGLATPGLMAPGQPLSSRPVGGTSALLAGGLLRAAPLVLPDGLWAVYTRAQQKSAAAWEQWRMMRQAGGTDGSAGFLFGQAYEAQRAAEQAYEAWKAAWSAAHPGVTGLARKQRRPDEH